MNKNFASLFLFVFLSVASAESESKAPCTAALNEDITYLPQKRGFSEASLAGNLKFFTTKAHWKIQFGDYNNLPKPEVKESWIDRLKKLAKPTTKEKLPPVQTITEPGVAKTFSAVITEKELSTENDLIFDATVVLQDLAPDQPDSPDRWTPLRYALASGLRIKASSLDPDLVYTVALHVTDSVTYSLNFKAPKDLKEIELNFANFRSQNNSKSLSTTLDETILFYRPQFSIQILKSQQRSALQPGQKIHLKLNDVVAVERDLRDPYLFENLAALKRSSNNDQKYDPEMTGDYRMRYQKEKPLLKKVVTNLYNVEHQNFALEVARQGEAAILQQLKQVGGGVIYLTGPMETSMFFNHNGLMDLNPRCVPIEKSSFGRDHSVWAHALQIIAMTKDLSESELRSFWFIFNSQSGGSIAGWAFWDTLFDAPGDRVPNAPRFWKRRMSELGITESIELSPEFKTEKLQNYHPMRTFQ